MTQNLLWRNNWSPISAFRRDLNHLFEDWSDLRSEETFTPACDIEDVGENFILSVEVPGVKKEDIKIEMLDNQIKVTGVRHSEKQKDLKNGSYSERNFGKFHRTFTLQHGVNPEEVRAHYQDGILRLVVPKAEQTKARQIEIRSEESVA